MFITYHITYQNWWSNSAPMWLQPRIKKIGVYSTQLFHGVQEQYSLLMAFMQVQCDVGVR